MKSTTHKPSTRTKRWILNLTAASLMLSGQAFSADYKAPRLANGQPDLQGSWTNASLTQLTRSPQFKSLVISPEQAEKIMAMRSQMNEKSLEKTDPNDPAPAAGSNVGGYNSFWIDPGASFAKINGEYRSNWIVDPANGQLPYSKEGKKIFDETAALFREHDANPEGRPMAERCIIGFGSTGGPPMINVLYNNNYQIVQSKDTVAILVEMNHDVRMVRLNDKHLPSNMRPWLGDSVGHWEGDTLVVETSNINPGEQLRLNFNQSFYISQNAKIQERFTRIADDAILYEFTVTDPEIYTQPWRAEVRLSKSSGKIYEYACHEGNYALPGILAGAREEEKAKQK